MKRCFLFLQGPIGPCFRLLARDLESHGHRVIKINFWGGDVFDFPEGIRFRENPDKWSDWILNIAQNNHVSDVVLFGDMRSRHREAIAVLKDRVPRIYVLEEGYYRPNWITVDRGGSNVNSSLPRTIVHYLKAGTKAVAPRQHEIVGPSLWSAVGLTMRSYALGLLLSPFFPHYRHHRLHHPLHEGILWVGRLFSSPFRRIEEALHLRSVLNYLGDHYVFPMQLEGDSQIRNHSKYTTIYECAEEVIASFAQHAPPDTHLFIKPHPLDPHIMRTKKIIKNLMRQYKVTGRVLWIDTPGVSFLLHGARGMVTINSTTGLVALSKHCPTKVMGQAFWDMDGLTHQGPLDEFWANPTPPTPENAAAFQKYVFEKTQVNGGLYSKNGLRILMPNLRQVIEDESWYTRGMSSHGSVK